jgi:hypothetical protein
LTRTIERITLGLNNNKATLALFLDIERAFDKVWITRLISKLIKAGIPAQFIHIIHNYLYNRAFTVVHGNSESTRRPIRARVLQGSLLGPVLFNIDINSTRINITHLDATLQIYINYIPYVENINVAVSIYADDKNVTVKSGSLQLAVNEPSNIIKTLEPCLKNGGLRLMLINARPHYSQSGRTIYAMIYLHLRFFEQILLGQMR